MTSHESPALLLASPDPALLRAVEPLLRTAGARVEVVLSAEAAVAFLVGGNPPTLFVLDARLPDMPISQLLAAARAIGDGPHVPIVLIADTVTQEWIDRLADGVIDDLILRPAEYAYWQLRINLMLRNQRLALELETLREAAIRNAQFDRLTGVYNRETMLSMLFRETDRAQRMNSSLCLVLFDITTLATGTRDWAWTPAMTCCARCRPIPVRSCAATICWGDPAWTSFWSPCRRAAPRAR